ncbi:hypothetical protein PTKIN_Ptkin05aG0124400 [Pterospermum kingtungense]
MHVTDGKDGFWAIEVYGHPEVGRRHIVWDQLVQFSQSLGLEEQWLAFEDFNQVLNEEDKVSFRSNSLRGTWIFRECLNRCQLSKIPSKGVHLTWTNNWEGSDTTWERLDRCFANYTCLDNHDSGYILNLPVWESDHGAMVISTKKDSHFHMRPYRFEAM